MCIRDRVFRKAPQHGSIGRGGNGGLALWCIAVHQRGKHGLVGRQLITAPRRRVRFPAGLRARNLRLVLPLGAGAPAALP
eukprot:4151368-Alexandrium_andersonii.AAC.1